MKLQQLIPLFQASILSVALPLSSAQEYPMIRWPTCSICVDGAQVGDLSPVPVSVAEGLVGSYKTCTEVDAVARDGQYSPATCILLRRELSDFCGCSTQKQEPALSYPELTATEPTVPTPRPTAQEPVPSPVTTESVTLMELRYIGDFSAAAGSSSAMKFLLTIAVQCTLLLVF